MARIILLEIDAYRRADGVIETLRFSESGFVTGPLDAAPHQIYPGLIAEAPTMTRTLFSQAHTFGQQKAGTGDIKLMNADGRLDKFGPESYAIAGRELRVLTGEEGDSYADLTVWLKGIVAVAGFDHDLVTLRLRDQMGVLDIEVQTSSFDGSNNGSEGIEGGADDIQGRAKPRLFGVNRNVPGVLENASLLIYGFNHDQNGATAPVASFDTIWDGGTVVTPGSDHADLATLQAATVAADEVDTCIAEGLARMGSAPNLGGITADITEGAAALDRSVAGIVERLLLEVPEISAADIDSVSLDAIDTLNASVVGTYINQIGATYRSVINALTESIGAYLITTRPGVFAPGSLAIVPLTAPTGKLDFSIHENSSLVALL